MTKLIKPSKEDLELHRINAGKVGVWLGTGDQLGKSIAAIVIVLLLVVGAVVTCSIPWTDASEFWNKTLPIITLALGYIFGVKNSNT